MVASVWSIGPGDERLAYNKDEAGDPRGFYAAALTWVASLGLDPTRLAPRATVVLIDGRYELHASEVVRDPVRGGDLIDRAKGEVVTTPVVVPVERDSWPARPTEVAV